jgi:hypothetical protein
MKTRDSTLGAPLSQYNLRPPQAPRELGIAPATAVATVVGAKLDDKVDDPPAASMSWSERMKAAKRARSSWRGAAAASHQLKVDEGKAPKGQALAAAMAREVVRLTAPLERDADGERKVADTYSSLFAHLYRNSYCVGGCALFYYMQPNIAKHHTNLDNSGAACARSRQS